MKFLNIHTHQAQNPNEWQNLYPNSPAIEGAFSVGIHPWHINEQWQTDFSQVEAKAALPACKAVGECGIDKLAPTSLALQTEIFLRHIALAQTVQKPLIIHCVRAYSEIIALKKQTKPTQMWVLHGFHKNEQTAWELLKNGIKLSFGEALLYDVRLQTLIKKLSPNDYFLETDTSSLPFETIYQKAQALTQ